MKDTRRKKRHNQRRKRIAGIGVAAMVLGVTRDHLRLVIQGKRSSAKLSASYRKLVNKTMLNESTAAIDDAVVKGLLRSLDAVVKRCDSAISILESRVTDVAGNRGRLEEVIKTMAEAQREFLEVVQSELHEQSLPAASISSPGL